MDRQKNWYLVFTKPRQEQKADHHLREQAFETYLPYCRAQRVRGGRRVAVSEPLFPGYLFIRLDTCSDNWAPIRSTPGVSRLVRFGPAPAPVPDACVALLRQHEDESGLHAIGSAPLNKGDKVHVLSGPFAGLEAVYLEPRGQDRAMILLNVLGGLKPVEMRQERIAPLRQG
jgi:transcriptional antiterminator RfaH